jgi:hypothetical protein
MPLPVRIEQAEVQHGLRPQLTRMTNRKAVGADDALPCRCHPFASTACQARSGCGTRASDPADRRER